MDDKVFSKKIIFFRIVIISLFLFLCGTMAYLQIIKGDENQFYAERNAEKNIPIAAPRGIIYDRKGVVIAKNLPQYYVSVLPAEVKDAGHLEEVLAPVLKMKKEEIDKILQANKGKFETVKLKEVLDLNTAAMISEVESDLPGIYLEKEPVRDYTGGALGSHFLGYVGAISEEELKELKQKGYSSRDVIGKDGIEKRYNGYLRGKDGARTLLVDAAGRMIAVLREKQPEPGNDLHLCIDWELQKTAEKALAETLKAIAAKNGNTSGGVVVAMDAENGEILALASLPGFNPNLFARGISVRDYDKLINDKTNPLFDRAIAGAFPCGSTFKLITGTAALQEKIANRYSVFYCPGVFYLGSFPFYCFVRGGHGSIGFVEAISLSCDVTFYTLGYRLGIKRLRKYAVQYGLGKKTGIDLPGESEGLFPTEEWKMKTYKEKWYDGDTVNLSIGQGYLGVTPLQLAVVTSAVANGGYVVRPHLIKKITLPGGQVLKDIKMKPVRRINISPENLAVMREGMRGAVTHGTGVAANIPNIEVAGKTGTAENVPTSDNPRGRNHAWFTCFAPYRHPKIVVTVLLEQSGGFGGQWAAPVARKVIEAYFKKQKPDIEKNTPARTGD